MKETYDVYKVQYMTYAEIDELGDRKRELVVQDLTFEAAKKKIEELGFGHSIHPSQMNPRS